MTSALDGRRDLAGWLAAATLTAALFGGAAAAALRLPPGPAGDAPLEAVALDLSVGVVSLSAMLPSEPPAAVPMTAPQALEAPRPEAAAPVLQPQPQPETATPVLPSLHPEPALRLPQQVDAPPLVPAEALPPPPRTEDPPLDLARSLRPMARPDLDREPPQPPEREQAEAAPARPNSPDPAPDPAPQEAARAAPAQPAGSEQAARPAQERRVAGGQSAARYGDTVLRQIAKLRRKKAPDRGVVTVGFEIGADGGLRRVAVVSSSGSPALDQVAVEHIRRAAPFPPPPEGAAVRFAFEFVGR